ncbi:hybrid sensor histidine kinase/response regulator [bacterium]|nr:hybrid sensor histidine kinase/response regulator [bacterium]
MLPLGITALLFTLLWLHEWRKRGVLEEQLTEIETLLQPSDTTLGDSPLDEQVRALLWQAQSQCDLGGELKDLGTVLREPLSAVRSKGMEAISSFPDQLKALTRCSEVVLVVSQHRKILACAESSQSCSSLPPVTTQLSSLLSQMIQKEVPPLHVELFEIDDDSPPLFASWKGLPYLLAAFHEREEEEADSYLLSLVFGYERGTLPLQREKEILREALRMIQRALREYDTVTEVSERAQQEQKSQEKYFAHISHDIRTPLNNIQMILDLFLLEGVHEENRHFLQVARANSQSLREIVEELLEFTKYRDGAIEIRREPFFLAKELQSVIEEFRLTAEVKQVTLRGEYCEDLVVSADRRQVKRILMNLVSNGLKYTTSGEVVAEMRQSGETVQVDVRDTGVGIPPEKIENLFVPFSRVGEVQVEGIGLGLPLSKMLTEANGGTLSVTSQHGAGSTFTLSFPRSTDEVLPDSRPDDVQGLQAEESPLQLVEVKKRPRVLVIDDDIDAGKSLARVLEALDFEVQSLSRVEDLSALLNFWSADLIISDMQMPNGGIESVIERKGPIPLIALTGCVDPAQLKRYRNHEQVSVLLQKPVDPKLLQDAILRVLPDDHAEPQSDVQ